MNFFIWKDFFNPYELHIFFWASSLAWNKWYNINWCKLHLNKMKVKERSHMSVASLLKEKHFLWPICIIYTSIYIFYSTGLVLCNVKKNGKTWIIIFYSIPCANIITSPGSSIISSLKQNGVTETKWSLIQEKKS